MVALESQLLNKYQEELNAILRVMQIKLKQIKYYL